MSDIRITPSNFETIAPIWRKYLWDERYDFKPTSAMLFKGGYDAEISIKFVPKFFLALRSDEIIGVISGHKSTDEHYRLRGLCVLPDYRGQGVSQLLIKKIIEEAKAEGCKMVWSTPRKGSVHLHEKMGFVIKSEFTCEGFLFGPNCYVSLDI